MRVSSAWLGIFTTGVAGCAAADYQQPVIEAQSAITNEALGSIMCLKAQVTDSSSSRLLDRPFVNSLVSGGLTFGSGSGRPMQERA